MQWLIDLIIEAIGIPPVFIDRGNPAARDMGFFNFTIDGAWHDVDLSGVVPVGATGVCLAVEIKANTADVLIDWRKKDNVNTINKSRVLTYLANVETSNDCTLAVNSDRVVQYRVIGAGVTDLSMVVKNWWF